MGACLMRRRWSGVLSLVVAVCLSLAAGECPQVPTGESGQSGTSNTTRKRPAGSVDSIDAIDEEEDPSVVPIAGPEEIPGPAALRFPASVTIPVGDALSTPAFSAFTAKDDNGNSVEIDMDVESFIRAVLSMAEQVTDMVDLVMSSRGLLGSVSVPRDRSITDYETVAPRGNLSGLTGDLFIDFGPFPSAHTITSGCSGNTLDLPICFRVWSRETDSSGWNRIVIGYFTAVPDETGEGEGFFWVDLTPLFPPRSFEDVTFDQQHGIRWNHKDPSAKATEQSLRYLTGAPNVGQIYASGKNLTAQWGGDGSCPQTLFKNSSTAFASSDSWETYTFIYPKLITSWKSCKPSLGARIGQEAEDPSHEVPPFNFCLNRSTAVPVSLNQCVAQGVDVRGENFLAQPDPADYTFPSLEVFPAEP